jgi:cation:H+ antiporter
LVKYVKDNAVGSIKRVSGFVKSATGGPGLDAAGIIGQYTSKEGSIEGWAFNCMDAVFRRSPDIPCRGEDYMMTALAAIAGGLILLVWSADRFVEGSAATARHFGMPPLLIGMVIVGFGTSAPEMLVSAMASLQNNPGIALGNAYGSNITNIALILGVTALIGPIVVHSQVLRQELPILIAVTALAAYQLRDGELSRLDAGVLLGVFAALMAWSIGQGLRQRADALSGEMERELVVHAMPLPRALSRVALGLVVLLISSRLLVWGAVEIARGLGVSDLIIGLTIVALGTSLPELASSITAIRKGEDDIAVGNVIGSNLFNTLAVVGIAGAIRPIDVAAEIFSRDIPVMSLLTVALFIISYGFRGQGRITRPGGAVLLAAYFAYTALLVVNAFG